MTPSQLKDKLAKEVPHLRWLQEPKIGDGLKGTITATADGKTVAIALKADDTVSIEMKDANGKDLAHWPESRPFEQWINIFRLHIHWYVKKPPAASQDSKPQAMARPPRKAS